MVERVELVGLNANDAQDPVDWKWSMLGKAQKEWLVNGITESKADWQLWGNQTRLAIARSC
ncbi:MAG: alkaline phosphatase D family protein [Microcoleaceae cyanobacterium]